MSNEEMMEFSPLGKQVFKVNRITKQVWINYGYACLTIAGADGEVAPAEFDHLAVEAVAMGATPDIIDAWKAYDFKSGDLNELLPTLVADAPINAARSLIYTAIKMSRADGVYHVDEQGAVKRAADILGVDSHTVTAIEGLAEMEEAVERVRAGLLENET